MTSKQTPNKKTKGLLAAALLLLEEEEQGDCRVCLGLLWPDGGLTGGSWLTSGSILNPARE